LDKVIYHASHLAAREPAEDFRTALLYGIFTEKIPCAHCASLRPARIGVMNKFFSPAKPFRVPDETLALPFLAAKDSESGLPFDLLDGLSPAAGEIGEVVAAACMDSLKWKEPPVRTINHEESAPAFVTADNSASNQRVRRKESQ